MNKLPFIFVLLICCATFAQSKTSLDVKITSVEKMRKKLENTSVVIYENDKKKDSIILLNGKYNLTLDTGIVYKIAFEKESYVTKYLVLNTKDAPKDSKKRSKLKIDIGLFHEKENLDVSFLKTEPIGYGRFDFISEKLEWDQDYLELIKGKIVRATLDYAKAKNY